MRIVSGLWNTPKNYNREVSILKKRDGKNKLHHRNELTNENLKFEELRCLTKNKEYELGFE